MNLLRFLILLTLSSSFVSRSADACTPNPNGWVASPTIQPADGTIKLPVNLQLLVQYEGDFRKEQYFQINLRDIRIISEYSEVVPTQITESKGYSQNYRLFIIKPKSFLLKSTRYFVQNRMKKGRCKDLYSKSCILSQYQSISSFTTGTFVDKESPNFGGLTGIKISEIKMSDSCGTFEGYNIGLQTQDDISNELHKSWIRYHLYDASDLTKPVAKYIKSHHRHTNIVCKGSYLSPYESLWVHKLKHGSYYILRAIDIAGNIDSNIQRKQYTGSCQRVNIEEKSHTNEREQELITSSDELRNREPPKELFESDAGTPVNDTTHQSIDFDKGDPQGSDIDSQSNEATKESLDTHLENKGCAGCNSNTNKNEGIFFLLIALLLIRRNSHVDSSQ